MPSGIVSTRGGSLGREPGVEGVVQTDMRSMLAALAGAVLGLVCARVSAKGACLKFSQSADGAARALTLRIDNDCPDDMTCSLSWRVTCVSASGRSTTA